MLSRRLIVAAGGGALASCLASRRWHAFAAEKTIAIHMKSDVQGAYVTFDPVGVFIEPGTTVRWVSDANVHTTTAYHPQNNHHCLRIPIEAQVWNSGYLLPKQAFAVTLTVEGVYDYFCIPHENAGMVGRIIVGKATGPGAEPFDYFKGMPQAAGGLAVPGAAQKAFPSIATILNQKVVRPANSPS
jgi:plastocyanin